MRSAILFLTYRRYQTTELVFRAIREAKPPRLYFASNAPNPNDDEDLLRVLKVRTLLKLVDWPCQVHTLFHDTHLAVKYSISSSISWFFNNEEEGIILEDDVLPLPSFFQYCDELLERYRHDARVGVISGCNLISQHFTPVESYYFSRYNHVWGWASWRRAWQYYDITMQAWPEWRDKGGLSSISDGKKLFELYWTSIFDRTFTGTINTWDYQWTFNCWYHGLITALPTHNQTQNLGFGDPDAVHTTGDAPDYVIESIPKLLTFPLLHPQRIIRSIKGDSLIDQMVYQITKTIYIRQYIREIPLIGGLLRKIKRFIFCVRYK